MLIDPRMILTFGEMKQYTKNLRFRFLISSLKSYDSVSGSGDGGATGFGATYCSCGLGGDLTMTCGESGGVTGGEITLTGEVRGLPLGVGCGVLIINLFSSCSQ